MVGCDEEAGDDDTSGDDDSAGDDNAGDDDDCRQWDTEWYYEYVEPPYECIDDAYCDSPQMAQALGCRLGTCLEEAFPILGMSAVYRFVFETQGNHDSSTCYSSDCVAVVVTLRDGAWEMASGESKAFIISPGLLRSTVPYTARRGSLAKSTPIPPVFSSSSPEATNAAS